MCSGFWPYQWKEYLIYRIMHKLLSVQMCIMNRLLVYNDDVSFINITHLLWHINSLIVLKLLLLKESHIFRISFMATVDVFNLSDWSRSNTSSIYNIFDYICIYFFISILFYLTAETPEWWRVPASVWYALRYLRHQTCLETDTTQERSWTLLNITH